MNWTKRKIATLVAVILGVTGIWWLSTPHTYADCVLHYSKPNVDHWAIQNACGLKFDSPHEQDATSGVPRWLIVSSRPLTPIPSLLIAYGGFLTLLRFTKGRRLRATDPIGALFAYGVTEALAYGLSIDDMHVLATIGLVAGTLIGLIWWGFSDIRQTKALFQMGAPKSRQAPHQSTEPESSFFDVEFAERPSTDPRFNSRKLNSAGGNLSELARRAGIVAALVAFGAFLLLRPEDTRNSTQPSQPAVLNEPAKPLHHAYDPNPAQDAIAAPPPGYMLDQRPLAKMDTAPNLPSVALPAPLIHPYVRPTLAPNGKPWPSIAGYLKGAPQKYTDGHSEITIDNTQNDFDVFVKVVATFDAAPDFPIRQLLIPAHRSFLVKSIRPGSYDVRFENLDTGEKSACPTFELTETHKTNGVEYTRYELTLYTVNNGNLQLRTITDDEF